MSLNNAELLQLLMKHFEDKDKFNIILNEHRNRFVPELLKEWLYVSNKYNNFSTAIIAHSVAKFIKNDLLAAKSLFVWGLILDDIGNSDSAISLYDSARKIFIEYSIIVNVTEIQATDSVERELKLIEILESNAKDKKSLNDIKQDANSMSHTRSIRHLNEDDKVSNLSTDQIEDLSKIRELETQTNEKKLIFMKKVMDRELEDFYNTQMFNTGRMGAVKPIEIPDEIIQRSNISSCESADLAMKICPQCNSSVGINAKFCGSCGSNIESNNPKSDSVHFSVTAPLKMKREKSYVLDVWAYLKEQEDDFIRQAKESQNNENIRIKSKNNVKVERGTFLTVHLAIPDLIVEDPEDTIYWDGELANATFSVKVPKDTNIDSYSGKVTIYANSILISKLHFIVEIGVQELPSDKLQINEQRIQRAFASYASEDRDEVFSRIQGINVVSPKMHVFTDVASIHPGDKWKSIIISEIMTCDVFYLFWSLAASRSEYVEMEWRTALEMRGIEYISPVPLVYPDEVPPPKELAELHFNDSALRYMRGKKSELQ